MPSIVCVSVSLLFPLSVHKLYLSLMMLLSAFKMKNAHNMCLFVSHRVMTVHGKGQNDNFKKVLKETIHFPLKTVLCGWHAFTNYTTVTVGLSIEGWLWLFVFILLRSLGVYTEGLLFLIAWGLDLERKQTYCLENKQWEISREYSSMFEISTSRFLHWHNVTVLHTQTFPAN